MVVRMCRRAAGGSDQRKGRCSISPLGNTIPLCPALEEGWAAEYLRWWAPGRTGCDGICSVGKRSQLSLYVADLWKWSEPGWLYAHHARGAWETGRSAHGLIGPTSALGAPSASALASSRRSPSWSACRSASWAECRAECWAELRAERLAEHGAEQRAERRAGLRAECRAEHGAEQRAERRAELCAEHGADRRAEHRAERRAEYRECLLAPAWPLEWAVTRDA